MMIVNLTENELELLRGKTENQEVLKAINAIDRKREWETKLKDVIDDLIVWPIVASIVEKQEAKTTFGHIGYIGTDLMGCKQGTFKRGRKESYEGGIEINGTKFTYKGWEKAKPLIQTALDYLGISFDPGRSGLVCKKGDYRMETIYTDTDGFQYRTFDMGHGASGFAGSCYPLFPKRHPNLDNSVSIWSYVLRLPKTTELVDIQGFKICGNCGLPKRPSN